MPQPLVSIIVCTYNRERFLSDCLDSIVGLKENLSKTLTGEASSGEDFEALIVDNNSTDGTAGIVHDYLEKYPEVNFRYVTEPKQGLSNARNRGVLEARGRYLAYVDDDAILEPDYVTKLKAFVEEHPDIMGFGGKIVPVFVDGPEPAWMNRFSRSLFLSEVNYGEETRQLLREHQYPFGCNMVIAKDYFERYGSFDSAIGPISKDGGRCDDKILFLDMRRHEQPIYYVHDLVVRHQIDTRRLTRDYIRKLSEGLGYSLRLLARKEGGMAVLRRGIDVIYKMAGVCVLSLGYLIIGRPAVSRHLIEFRWWVMRGYFKK